jgi:hypothetical protein
VITSLDDLFKPPEQPTEVSVAQTHSKGQPRSKDTSVAQASQSKLIPDQPKIPFAPSKKPISIHTWESPKLYYNIVEDLKKLKANISVMDICIIPQQKEFMLQALGSVEDSMAGNGQQKNLSPTGLLSKTTLNTYIEGRKERPFVLLESEVTPGLQQEQSPTPISFMSQFVYKG